MNNRIAIAILIASSVTFGCGGGSSQGAAGTSGTSGASGTASLRVLNASQDVNSVNVIVGGDTVVSGDAYPTCVFEVCKTLSAYVQAQSGGVSFALEDSLKPSQNFVPSQFQKLKLASNTQNTFVLSGPPSENVNDPDTGYLFVDDSVPAANSVKIRIVNVDPRNPTVSAFILPNGVTPSGTAPVSNLALGMASNYITMPPGSYTVWFVGNFGVLGPMPNMSWGPTTYSANQNFSVYLMQQINSSRAVILADN